MAVSTDRGLMVPVVQGADRLSFAAIEQAIAAYAAKARDGTISVDDLQGGTFTITNGGTFGSLMSTPILNPPQSAILGMHAIKKRAVVVDDQVVVRPMMYLALVIRSSPDRRPRGGQFPGEGQGLHREPGTNDVRGLTRRRPRSATRFGGLGRSRIATIEELELAAQFDLVVIGAGPADTWRRSGPRSSG